MKGFISHGKYYYIIMKNYKKENIKIGNLIDWGSLVGRRRRSKAGKEYEENRLKWIEEKPTNMKDKGDERSNLSSLFYSIVGILWIFFISYWKETKLILFRIYTHSPVIFDCHDKKKVNWLIDFTFWIWRFLWILDNS